MAEKKPNEALGLTGVVREWIENMRSLGMPPLPEDKRKELYEYIDKKFDEIRKRMKGGEQK